MDQKQYNVSVAHDLERQNFYIPVFELLRMTVYLKFFNLQQSASSAAAPLNLLPRLDTETTGP